MTLTTFWGNMGTILGATAVLCTSIAPMIASTRVHGIVVTIAGICAALAGVAGGQGNRESMTGSPEE